MRQNVILFFPDSFTQKVLDEGTKNGLHLPNIKRLQQMGTTFTNCIVQNPVCTPSRCCLFTGRYVHNDGHRSLSNLLQPHEGHLFEYLQQGGYETNIIGKNDLFTESIVDKYVKNAKDNLYKPSHFPTPKYDVSDKRYYSFQYQPSSGGVYEKDTYFIEKAKDYINQTHDKPYFLFIPINLPHPGYFSHPQWEAITKEDITAIKDVVEKEKPLFHQLIRETRYLNALPDEEFKEIKATYYNMCLYVDYLLGQVLDAIPCYDSTTIIFSSDHGDYQGNYHLVEKWPSSAEEEIINVPLIFAGATMKKNHVVETPVELIDMMQTILDITKTTSKEKHFSYSLLPILEGRHHLHKEYVFCEGGYDLHDEHIFEGKKLPNPSSIYYPKAYLQQKVKESVCRFVMIRNHQYKLVKRTSDIDELYDLVQDPDELVNLINHKDYEEVINTLEKELLSWYIRTSDITPTKVDKRNF